MKKLYGVTTAMVTPFDENGKVDLPKLRNLTEYLISKGVNCLYPCGTTGEMFRLSLQDRKDIAECVVKTADHRVTVFLHVGAMNQEDTVELARHSAAIGADGIGVVTPAFFTANDREIETYFVNVASSVPDDFPVYLYNIPQCAANDLKTDVAKRVADRCRNVIGIKYSYPDLLRTQEYLTIRDGDISVMQGTDRLFLASLAVGCDGTISGVSCVYPEPFVALYKAFCDNDLPMARKMQKIAVKYVEALKSGSNMSYFKEALKMRGIDAGHMKAPQLDITEQEIGDLRKMLEQINHETGVQL